MQKDIQHVKNPWGVVAAIAGYPARREPRRMPTPPKAPARPRVVALREQLSLTQVELQRRCGVSQAAISRYQNGETIMPEHAAAIARALGTTVDYLEGRTDDPSPTPEPQNRGEGLSEAILRALDKRRHTLADARAVEDAMSSVVSMLGVAAPLDQAARAWLDAAADLRRDRQPVTVSALLVRVTRELVGRHGDLNENGDRELAALGGGPPANPVKIPG